MAVNGTSNTDRADSTYDVDNMHGATAVAPPPPPPPPDFGQILGGILTGGLSLVLGAMFGPKPQTQLQPPPPPPPTTANQPSGYAPPPPPPPTMPNPKRAEYQQDVDATQELMATFKEVSLAGPKGLPPPPGSESTISDAKLQYVKDHPDDFSAAAVAAANYFLSHPAQLSALKLSSGDGNETIGRSDLSTFLSEKKASLASTPATIATTPTAPPPPSAPPVSVTPPPGNTSTGDTSTTGGAGSNRTGTSSSSGGATGTDGVDRVNDKHVKVAGDPLEQARDNIENAKTELENRIEESTAALTKELAKGDKADQSTIATLRRGIERMTNSETMLNQLSNQLEQMIQNIMNMRHESAMNSIRHIQ